MIENWKSPAAYKGFYEVSDEGRVRSLPRTRRSSYGSRSVVAGRMMKLNRTLPYDTVGLSRERKVGHFYVHRLVWETFVGPVAKGTEINHKNSDKRDNRLVNLECVTRRGNVWHAIRAGKNAHMTPGNTPGTKLTMEKAREIRRRIKDGEVQALIASDMKVCRQTITTIKQNAIWRE